VRHLAAARFFESLGTDEIAGGLAGHYLAAHANAAEGPEADALAGQARIALKAAAERAAELGSHGQAQTFFEQALTVTHDPAEEAELLEHAGQAASMTGRHELAEAHLRKAIDVRRALGDRPAIARATTALGRALIAPLRTSEAIALLEPATAEFADLAADPAGIAIAGQLARAYFLSDDHRRAIEVADRVLEAAERADLRAIVADTLVTRGTALAILGRAIEGLGVVRAGRELAETLELSEVVLRAINNIVVVDAVRDPRAALATSRAGLTLARRLGARSWVPGLLDGLANCGLRTGDWTPTLLEIMTTLDDDWEAPDQAWILVDATILESVRGEPVTGRVEELARLVGDSGDVQIQGNAAHMAGFVAFAQGDLEVARDAWHRATALSAGQLMYAAPRAARVELWLGDAAGAAADLAALDDSGAHGPAIGADRWTIRAGIAALEGRPAEALPLYREALRAWRDLGLAWDEALCGIDMATLLDPADPEVRAAADSAREILARLGAKPFLERLDTAMERQPSASAPEPARSPDPLTA